MHQSNIMVSNQTLQLLPDSREVPRLDLDQKVIPHYVNYEIAHINLKPVPWECIPALY